MRAMPGVHEQTTTTGTGTLTVTSKTGFARFQDAYKVGEIFPYSLEDGNNKEAGIGKLATATTIERKIVFLTLDGTTFDETNPSALNLAAGTKEIYVSDIGGKYAFSSHNSDATASFIPMSHFSEPGGTSRTYAAGEIVAVPWECNAIGRITQLVVHALTASVDIILGLCGCDIDGTPGVVLAETAVTASSVGTAGINVTQERLITPGPYWLIAHVAGSLAFRTWQSDSGAPSWAGVNSSTNLADYVIQHWGSRTFGAPLPDNFDFSANTGHNNTSGGDPPIMGVVLA